MEWIGPLLTGILVLLLVFQLFWAHTISAIAEKTEQSELMQVLAWIPILQIAPTLAAGGGSVGRFLLGAVGLMFGNGALIAVVVALGGSPLGSLVATAGIGLTCLLCVVYFGRIASKTATARDLPGWVGLLIFIPIINLFIYPYIAFHDGWVGPNKIGMAIGSVLIFGSSVPTFQTAQTLSETDGFSPTFFLSMAKGDGTDLDGLDEMHAKIIADLQPPTKQEVPESSEVARLAEQQNASLRVLYELKGRFDALDSLTANTPVSNDADRRQALNIIESIRADLELNRLVLDSETYMDLGNHLLEFEVRLQAPSSNSLATRKDEDDSQIGPASIGMNSDPSPPRFGDRVTPPTRPFSIRADDDCPQGTERYEKKEAGSEIEWCQQPAANGGLRHGWYAKYLEDGQPESMGQYTDGMRVGVWTRFYPTGEVRAQAEFEEGMQHGWMLSFDKMGERTRGVRYERGNPVTPQ